MKGYPKVIVHVDFLVTRLELVGRLGLELYMHYLGKPD